MTQELRKLADDLDAEFAQGRISNHNGRKAAAEIRLLLDRLEKAEKDAERYRFIRSKSRSDLYDLGVDLDWYAPVIDLNEQVDAAMEASK